MIKKLSDLKVGDIVSRFIGDHITMQLVVSEVTNTTIVCRAYKFDKETGGEIDEGLGWDGKIKSGSRIEPDRLEYTVKK